MGERIGRFWACLILAPIFVGYMIAYMVGDAWDNWRKHRWIKNYEAEKRRSLQHVEPQE